MVRVIFLHPDLGIGGAERLVVDAALALQEKGHYVHFVTSHHDPNHCFLETKNGTLPVTVVGDWLPRSIFGKFYALCAYFRMMYAAFYLTFFSGLEPNIVFCDLVSICIPVLKLRVPFVLFYCHFPDQLLSKPGGYLKSIYRAPLNWLEEKTTGLADQIFVNSKFTATVFHKTFTSLKVSPKVLYPSLHTDFFDKSPSVNLNEFIQLESLSKHSFIFLSINRYERKKNLALAVCALDVLRNSVEKEIFSKIHLIVAGGYDTRVQENVEYYDELSKYANELKLSGHVSFLKSPSDVEKVSLLRNCHCLIYTPSHEHFGIVPLEAMYLEKPVIAVNNGGPTETVVNNETGFLCEETPEDFAHAMKESLNINLMLEFGKAGKRRVVENFSFSAFADQLDFIICNLLKIDNKKD